MDNNRSQPILPNRINDFESEPEHHYNFKNYQPKSISSQHFDHDYDSKN